MGSSLKVASVFGIEVRIHVTFLLFLAWIWFSSYQVEGVSGALQGVLFILILFACVLLHEFGHAFAARAFGIRTPDITLYAIGGVARLNRIPDKPWQELVVAVAGPMVNVVIAAILIFGIHVTAGLQQVEHLESPRDRTAGKSGVRQCDFGFVQFDPGIPDGWRPGSSSALGNGHAVRSCHHHRRSDRAGPRRRLRYLWIFRQSYSDLYRNLYLCRSTAGSRYGTSESIFAAMMKSLRCNPRILCVQRVTVTRPHSVKMAG